LITWSSKEQSIVVLSCTEVEYVGVKSAGTQTLWVRKFLEEIREKQIHPTVIYYDNVSAIKLAKNLVHHSTTKHFDMKYHTLNRYLHRSSYKNSIFGTMK